MSDQLNETSLDAAAESLPRPPATEGDILELRRLIDTGSMVVAETRCRELLQGGDNAVLHHLLGYIGMLSQQHDMSIASACWRRSWGFRTGATTS